MIGAMPAVAVRHERRKNKKDHPDAEPGLLHGPSKNVRPKRGNLLLKSRLTSPPSATAASLRRAESQTASVGDIPGGAAK